MKHLFNLVLNFILEIALGILRRFLKPKPIEQAVVEPLPIAEPVKELIFDPEEPYPYKTFRDIEFSDVMKSDLFLKDTLERVVSLKNNGFVDAAFHADIVSSMVPHLSKDEIYDVAHDYIKAGIAPQGVIFALFEAYRDNSNKGVNKSMEKAKKIVEDIANSK